MSDFTYVPLKGLNVTRQPRTGIASFGDDYEQRVNRSINPIKGEWNLTFRNRSTIIDAIDAFFVLKNGVASFTWTPKGSSEIKVRCPSWNKVFIEFDVYELQAKFVQVFE